MRDEYSQLLYRACAAFGVALVLSAATEALFAPAGPRNVGMAFFGEVLVIVTLTAVVAVPFFLVHVLFVWPVLRRHANTPARLAIEALLVGLASLGVQRLVHGNWAGAEHGVAHGFVVYAFYRASSWAIAWLAPLA